MERIVLMPDTLDTAMVFYRSRDISGGMNDKVFPTQILDNQSAELLDVDISIPGKRKKRDGYTIFADDKGSERINALADFKPDVTGTRARAGKTRPS